MDVKSCGLIQIELKKKKEMVSQCEKTFDNMNNYMKTHLPNQHSNQPKQNFTELSI